MAPIILSMQNPNCGDYLIFYFLWQKQNEEINGQQLKRIRVAVIVQSVVRMESFSL